MNKFKFKHIFYIEGCFSVEKLVLIKLAMSRPHVMISLYPRGATHIVRGDNDTTYTDYNRPEPTDISELIEWPLNKFITFIINDESEGDVSDSDIIDMDQFKISLHKQFEFYHKAQLHCFTKTYMFRVQYDDGWDTLKQHTHPSKDAYARVIYLSY